MPDILIVEDDFRMRSLLVELLERDGYTVNAARDGRGAVTALREHSYDVVLTDLKIPRGDGMDILACSNEVNSNTPVIVITAYATVNSAVEAMKKGAYDYIQKPFDPDELLLLVKRAVDYRKLIDENIRLSTELKNCIGDEFVGISKGITKTKKLVAKVAPFDTTVLIQGETGSGKEMVARLIHRLSKRSSEKFLPVNCAALSETLLEAELFGYEKGAFTGATQQKKGLFEAIRGGTIFLDEINNASQSVQIKLLRVLQDGTIMRVGGVEPFEVDIRILAASNSDLKKEVETGKFRKDLLYRLNVTIIDIPPLRNRKDDIPILAYHFLNKYNQRFSRKIKAFHPDTMELLINYSWPGNVRELENVVEHAVIITQSQQDISPEHLSMDIRKGQQSILPAPPSFMRLDDMEQTLIQQALLISNGHKAQAAKALGISTATLWRKLKKLRIG